MIGNKIYNLAKRLWPINRSITGNGVRDTLKILREICPKMKIIEVPYSSVGRALPWKGRDRVFNSHCGHHDYI